MPFFCPVFGGRRIAPVIGFSVEVNKFRNFDYIQSVNYAPSQLLDRDIDSTIEDKSVFISTLIIIGLRAKPALLLLNRQLELNTIFHYSPRNFLERPIQLAPFEIEGRYHFVSVGINLFLNKSANNHD